MLRSLIAYDADGNVIATLDHMVAKDENGNVIGVVDFEAHEETNGRLREVWEVATAVGSATWPEWIGAAAYDFKVELDSMPHPARAKIVALVHKKSGHRRDRGVIEAEIQARIDAKRSEAQKAGEETRRDLRRRKMPDEMVELVQDPEPEPADLRDLLGGPQRPLLLDENGRTKARVKAQRPDLPMVRR